MTHIDTTRVQPIWFPNQRVIRTILQTIASTLVTVAGLAGFLVLFTPQLLEAIREVLPPSWYAWSVLAIGVLGTISGVLAKVMAIPAVNAFLTRFGAGSVPASVASDPRSVRSPTDSGDGAVGYAPRSR